MSSPSMALVPEDMFMLRWRKVLLRLTRFLKVRLEEAEAEIKVSLG